MDSKIFEMIFQVIGGLGLFLFGMNSMSEGMQKIAGEKLKKIIGAVTNNRFLAVGIGVLVTGIIQSSSVTTVMVIGFVNAQIMNLSQALGVILGANIGTTVTGWILVIDMIKYGLPVAGLASIVLLFSKKEATKIKATMVMGIGLVFFGLNLMSSGLKPVKDMPAFIEFFHKFDASTMSGVILCAFIGMLTTAVVQSSSATLGITITLAMQGLITPETGVALVLGENIGTTITAYLASLGTSINAKRAALAHFGFNFIGVIWVLSIFPYYLKVLHFVTNDSANIALQIATAHTMFNISNVCLFIPFTKQYAKLLVKLIPDDGSILEEKFTRLDKRMLETPAIALELVKEELVSAGEAISNLFDNYEIILSEKHDKTSPVVKKMFSEEDRLDMVQKEISEISKEALLLELPYSQIFDAKIGLSLADEYETISDYLLGQTKQYLKIRDNIGSLNENEFSDILDINKKMKEYFNFINDNYKENTTHNNFEEITSRKKELVLYYKHIRDNYLERAETVIYPVEFITTYMEILNNYRRITNHIYHVSEILSENSFNK